jgi:hypothetical protein
MCSVKCVYCEEEITINEEAWTLHEPQPKCALCRKDPKRMREHIRRRGGIGAGLSGIPTLVSLPPKTAPIPQELSYVH